MLRSSVKPSYGSLSTEGRHAGEVTRRVASAAALLSIAVWAGGLVALGAIAAPVVFSVVAYPSSADAMTLVFQRFDAVAMVCSAVVLASEASRAAARLPFAPPDFARAVASLLAAGAAAVEATAISPRIAALHAAGIQRGSGPGGVELARLHGLAELCGKAELFLLASVVLLHVATVGASRARVREKP